MQFKSFIKALVATVVLAAATSANAGLISTASSWSASGADFTSVTKQADGALDLYYRKGYYWCAGCGNNYWNFTTIATETGTGTFDFHYNAFDAWYMATSDLSFYVNNVRQAYYGGYDVMGSVSLNVHAGDTVRIMAHEYNYDGTDSVWGNIHMTKFGGAFADVPEPASVALMGLGLLGLAAARRKSRRG